MPLTPEFLRLRRWHKYEADAARHWEGVWEDHWRGKDFATLVSDAEGAPVRAFLVRHLPPRGAALESGCGHGQWLKVLAAPGRVLVGLDRFPGPMRRGLASEPGLRFVQGDVTRLPLRDGTLAGVLSFGVVEHFEEGFAAPLDEMRRVLGEGGVMLISVPYHNLIRCALEPFRLALESVRAHPGFRRFRGKAPLAPRRFYQYAYTASEFRRRLGDHGFASVDMLVFDTEFGLIRDYAVIRALRRRAPRAFRTLHRVLVAVSPRTCAHMQIHAAVPRRDAGQDRGGPGSAQRGARRSTSPA